MKNVTMTTNLICTKQPSFRKHSIGASTPNLSIFSSCYKTKIKFIKEMSLFSFPEMNRSGSRASMTVEAAIVVPLFLFFVLNLLSIIEVYSLHGTLTAALREVGHELSVYAYAYDVIVQEETDDGLEAFVENVAFSYLYVKTRVESFAGVQYLDASPLAEGRNGLSYLESSILQQDEEIDLIVTYRVSPFISLVGFRPARFYNRYYGRAWTGYDVEKGESAGEVYVAENAEVYHMERECTHLLLSIRECSAAEVTNLRNADGNKYRACETCLTEGVSELYVTDRGYCYHGQLNCSGLKRTIFVMTQTEAERYYDACSRCGR